MATFPVPSNPAINISYVEQVKRSDFVEASFINGYFLQFLENDQHLLNKNTELATSVDNKLTRMRTEIINTVNTELEEMQQEIEQGAVQECTEQEILALFL